MYAWWSRPMREPPPTPLLASSATGSSTNCLSAPFPPRHLRLQISLSCTCTVGHLKLCWPIRDQEQEMDRWYSHTLCGQEFAQILAQWVWNLRLELGQQLSPSELRTTEFAPAHEAEPSSTDESESPAAPPPAVTYGPPQWARSSFTHGFPGSAFTPQPDGSLRCPANHPLYLQERRPERDGSLRFLYAARIGHCRACPRLCTVSGEQHHAGSTTEKSRCFGRSPLLTQNPRRHLAQPLLPLLLLRCSGATGHVAASGEPG